MKLLRWTFSWFGRVKGVSGAAEDRGARAVAEEVRWYSEAVARDHYRRKTFVRWFLVPHSHVARVAIGTAELM